MTGAARKGRGPADRISVVALGFSIGIAAAGHSPGAGAGGFGFGFGFGPWAGAGAAAAVVAMLARRAPRAQMAAIGLAVVAMGGAWLTLRVSCASPRDLAVALGAEPVLARVEGVAMEPPGVVDPPAGSMSRFDYRGPLTCFGLRVDTVIARDGARFRRRGRVLVCVEESVAPFEIGARVEVTGMLQRLPPPTNPGASGPRQLAGGRTQAGVLRVASREMVTVTGEGRTRRSLRVWRESIQRRARAWLLTGLPEGGAAARSRRPDASPDARRDALLLALLLGERDGDTRGHDAFRRVGVAHLLAISGLHLGVVVSLAVLSLGRRAPPRSRGAIIVVIVLAYLLLVEVRLPVLRAAVMAIAVGLGMASGRRPRTASLVSLSAILLLAWRPEDLFQPGFQLSFGVVLGLVHFAPRVRERWFGRPDRTAATSAQMLGQWLATGLAAAAVAWAIALPIVAHHFGMISPWGVPLSLITLPLVALLLGLGYAKILLALVLPSGALLVGAMLAVVGDLLLSIVETVDALPGSVIYVGRPSAAWTIGALAWVGAWASGVFARGGSVGRSVGRSAGGSGGRFPGATCGAGGAALLAVWLAWPALAPAPPLRLDMLAVGDGTCQVVRSGGDVLVFDAGSISSPNVATRTLVPALRELGVRTIDTLAISHPNLDHFSAVIELVEAFRVREVLVTAPFETQAGAAPDGPAAGVLAELGRRRVAVARAAAGRTWALGDARVTCLHPTAGAIYESENDSSMVLGIEVGTRRVLLTGDLEAGGVRELRRRMPDLRADVVELPHHGAYDDRVAAFVRNLAPAVALQSTGPRRWRRDGWEEALSGVERLVTARDGACRVEIDGEGRIRVGRFADAGCLRVEPHDVTAP